MKLARQVLRQFRFTNLAFWRNPASAFFTFAFPLLFLVIFTSLLGGDEVTLRGTDLELNVGYSHPVVMKPRPGITFEVPVPTQVIVKGTDKQQVGQTAAEIRAVRKPEPYKGKGIRYQDEYVRRKVGKRA